VLNERSLVLEGVTLCEVVKLVIQVLVDLAAGTVLHKKATEDPLATHPEDLPVAHVSATNFQTSLLVPSRLLSGFGG